MITPINSMRGALMVWLISYVFFLITLASNFSAAHDSINYLLHIVRGDHLFHQHHLLYNFSAHAWLQLLHKIFPGVPSYYLVESFTALWGSAVLSVAFLFFRNRFQLPINLSLIGVSLIAFSFGTWFYSVNVEVYTPPMFLILCCLYVMSKRELIKGDIFLVGILHSAAILFHQVNVLFVPVVIYWLYSKRTEIPLLKSLVQYSLVGIFIAGGLYFFIGWVVEGHRTAGDFIHWVFGYTSGHNYWRPLSLKTPFAVSTGFIRSFVGGHFIFQQPGLQNAVEESYRAHQLRDEIFLARNISIAMTWLLTILTVFFIFLMIVFVFRFIQSFRKMKSHSHVIRPLLLCIAVYSLFFCFWMPEILDFWILQMVLFWILLVGTMPVHSKESAKMPLLSVLLVTLFLINFFGSIRWLRDPDNDWYLIESKKLDHSLTSNDVVIVENDWILKDYVRYFSKARVIATDDADFDITVARKIVNDAITSNNKVYIYRQPVQGDVGGGWKPIRSY